MSMLYEVIECEQGTPEWHLARAGVLTASMFVVVRGKVGCLTEQQQKYVDAIRSGADKKSAMLDAGYSSAPRSASVEKAINGEPVGDYSDAAKNYAFRVAVERISGEVLDDGFETWQMRRGRELEPVCRKRHEEDIDMLVDLAGFVRTVDLKFGCSADSLMDEDGGAEYKCFLAPDKLRSIILDDDWGDIMDQVQGSMWITGRKYWDMCLYCPALASVGKDFVRKRVERDNDYIEALEADMVAFERYVTSIEDRLRASIPDSSDIPLSP